MEHCRNTLTSFGALTNLKLLSDALQPAAQPMTNTKKSVVLHFKRKVAADGFHMMAADDRKIAPVAAAMSTRKEHKYSDYREM